MNVTVPELQVALRFEPLRRNAARKGGYGAWIVADLGIALPGEHALYVRRGLLYLAVVRAYNRGGVVSPVKLALEFVRQREEMWSVPSGAPLIYFGKEAHG